MQAKAIAERAIPNSQNLQSTWASSRIIGHLLSGQDNVARLMVAPQAFGARGQERAEFECVGGRYGAVTRRARRRS